MEDKIKIGIFGTGTWGLALGRMLANDGYDITMCSSNKQKAEELDKQRSHPNLKGMSIPTSIIFTDDIRKTCEDKDVLIIAVASVYVRETINKIKDYVKDNQIIVNVAKGIEADTLMMMSEVIRDELANDKIRIVTLSGPTHAEEVALDLPTTIVSASDDEEAAKIIQEIFMNTCMRVYTNDNHLGVELCGALKNIIALAAGMSSGLGYGDNAKAAIITRGMVEMMKLGKAMGAKPETFSGLAGIGDLIVTCTSMHSRNNRCGMLIGQGKTVEEATKEVGMVVEGLNALKAAVKLKEKYNVEMPIVSMVDAIVNNKISPEDAVKALMSRKKKNETDF